MEIIGLTVAQVKSCALGLLITLTLTKWASASDYCDACDRDKHGRIQRSAAVRAEFKRVYLCPATNKPRGACPSYVIDHIIPLKRGGADSLANMQWQTTSEAKAKDRLE